MIFSYKINYLCEDSTIGGLILHVKSYHRIVYCIKNAESCQAFERTTLIKIIHFVKRKTFRGHGFTHLAA